MKYNYIVMILWRDPPVEKPNCAQFKKIILDNRWTHHDREIIKISVLSAHLSEEESIIADASLFVITTWEC